MAASIFIHQFYWHIKNSEMRLFETLNNHNPELARAIWGKQMSLTDKIAELRKEVQSAEGGPA